MLLAGLLLSGALSAAPATVAEAVCSESGAERFPAVAGAPLDVRVELAAIARSSGRPLTEVSLGLAGRSSDGPILVLGELARGDRVTDSFKVRFEPAPQVSSDRLALRRAWPVGAGCLRLYVEDLATGAAFFEQRELDVERSGAVGASSSRRPGEVFAGSSRGRFGVTLARPIGRGAYPREIVIDARVSGPGRALLDRVDVFLDDSRVATHFQAPVRQPLLLGGGNPRFVRVVAYRRDGVEAEDVALLDPAVLGTRVDVHFVEAPTTVTRRGRPVPDLPASAFRLFEDGVRQEIVRFEAPAGEPVSVMLLIDASESMDDHLGEVRSAALRFVRHTLRDGDRAAIVLFRGSPRLRADFTADRARLVTALQDLEAKGATALYDALAFALARFDGVQGRRALFLFSDGRDEGSGLDFAGALRHVRARRVPIYAVGMTGSDPRGARERLARLAEESGGESFVVGDAGQLHSIWSGLRRRLGAQYLLGYQSSQGSGESYRTIEVQVDDPELEVRALRGYYP